MPRNPQDTDVRVMIPRRAEAAWRRVSATMGGKLAEVGVEPTNANIMAGALGLLDQMLHPDRAVPIGLSPDSPITERPDGSGIEVFAGGRIGKRVDPDEPPTERGVPIRPAPETADDDS